MPRRISLSQVRSKLRQAQNKFLSVLGFSSEAKHSTNRADSLTMRRITQAVAGR